MARRTRRKPATPRARAEAAARGDAVTGDAVTQDAATGEGPKGGAQAETVEAAAKDRAEPGRLRRSWEMLKETISEWRKDDVPRLGASLAYYTVFSLSPLLLIVIAIAGVVFGAEAVQGRIVEEIGGLVGTEGALLIQSMIESANRPRTGIVAGTIAVATLLFGATGVFVQLQAALNKMWGVEGRRRSGWLRTLRSRFLSFVSVLGIGFLLLVSLALNAALSAFMELVGGWLPPELQIARIAHFLLFLGLITLLFAMMYKLLPDVSIAWGDVWMGAAVTALLFAAGQFLVGLYLGRSGVASAYGAAGTVVVILLWVYYAAQIFLLGAEFTYVYAKRCGSKCAGFGGTAPSGSRRSREKGDRA